MKNNFDLLRLIFAVVVGVGTQSDLLFRGLAELIDLEHPTRGILRAHHRDHRSSDQGQKQYSKQQLVHQGHILEKLPDRNQFELLLRLHSVSNYCQPKSKTHSTTSKVY